MNDEVTSNEYRGFKSKKALVPLDFLYTVSAFVDDIWEFVKLSCTYLSMPL